MSSLLDQLHNATNPTATAGNIVFVVDIIIPVLSRCVLHELHACMYVCMDTGGHVCTCICASECMYVCRHAHVYVYSRII